MREVKKNCLWLRQTRRLAIDLRTNEQWNSIIIITNCILMSVAVTKAKNTHHIKAMTSSPRIFSFFFFIILVIARVQWEVVKRFCFLCFCFQFSFSSENFFFPLYYASYCYYNKFCPNLYFSRNGIKNVSILMSIEASVIHAVYQGGNYCSFSICFGRFVCNYLFSFVSPFLFICFVDSNKKKE